MNKNLGNNKIPCPWPESIWVAAMDDIPELIPDIKNRTSASGVLSRFGWSKYEQIIENALKRSNDIRLDQCIQCGQWCFVAGSKEHICSDCEK